MATATITGTGTDLLRAAAAGILQRQFLLGRTDTLGCRCGAVSQTVTPYSFDERGRPDERVLWGVVEIIEHTIERDDSHVFTTLVSA